MKKGTTVSEVFWFGKDGTVDSLQNISQKDCYIPFAETI
jgi:hypothetical protein